MTRPTRNRLVVVLFMAVAFFSAPRLPNLALWGATAVASPIVAARDWLATSSITTP